jgi:hypothetical protein
VVKPTDLISYLENDKLNELAQNIEKSIIKAIESVK